MNKKSTISILLIMLLIGTSIVPTALSAEKRTLKMNEPISATVDLHQDELQQNKDIQITIDSPDKSPQKKVINNPPNEPNNPSPYDGEIGVPLHKHSSGAYNKLSFYWNGGDLDGDEVTYNILIGRTNPPVELSVYYSVSGDGPFNQVIGIGDLAHYDTTYYWQITADDGNGGFTEGPIWSFTTKDFPTISGTIYYEGIMEDNTIYVYEDYLGLMETITLAKRDDGFVSYSFEVPNGQYYVSAFMDTDDNGVHDDGEQIGKVWALGGGMGGIFVTDEDVIVNINMHPTNKPTVPEYLSPSNGTVDIPVDELLVPLLSWSHSTDPDGDDVFYRVHLSPYYEPGVFGKIWGPTEFPTTIPIYSDWVNSDIYWKIVACTRDGAESSGPIWSFHTEGISYEPINPNPADGATNILIDSGPLIQWDTGHPVPLSIKNHIYFGTDPIPPLHGTTGWFLLSDESYHTFASNLGIPLQYDTTYYWKIITEDQFQALTEGTVWSFTTERAPIPNIMEAWSCASHTGITDDIKFPIDPDSEFGVVEPRDQSRNLSSNENDLYVEIVFDRDVDVNDLHISISPSPPIGYVKIQDFDGLNKIKINYLSKIPNGIYHIQIRDEQTEIIIGEFNVSYLNGDVTGTGIVGGKDRGEILNSDNWQLQLNDVHNPNPRCDINRNGIIEGLDIARIRNSANWKQKII